MDINVNPDIKFDTGMGRKEQNKLAKKTADSNKSENIEKTLLTVNSDNNAQDVITDKPELEF